MKRHRLLVLIAALMFTGRACADAGIPPPQVDLGFLFKNLESYPGFDFYLKYHLGRGNPKGGPPQLTRVQPGALTRLEGSGNRHSEIFLIAVPRGQKAPFPENAAKADWFKNPPLGGLQSAPLQGGPGGAGLGNGYDITYQVRLEKDRLEVEWVESNLNAWWFNAELICILAGAACVFIPIGFVVLLVWLIRRRPATPPV